MTVLLKGQDARRRRELRSGDFAPNCAERYRHMRIIADALGLSHVVARHHVELVIIFSEPNGRGDAYAIFAEGFERNVFLTGDCSWNRTGHVPF